jgi:hypothetical protein
LVQCRDSDVVQKIIRKEKTNLAFKKMQYKLLQIAERCERRGKHELAEKVRETVDDLRWSNFNSRITVAFDLALESKLDATFENILPTIASLSGYSVDELRKLPNIQEYFDCGKRIAGRRAAREQELQERIQSRW